MTLIGHTLPGPLAEEGWLEFNKRKHGVEPLRYWFEDNALGEIGCVLYLDRRGRVRMPRLNPFAPLWWTGRRSDKSYRRIRQWLTLAGRLVDEMRARGVANRITFPAGITDMRPWQWRGFRVAPSYTYIVSLPSSSRETDPEVRRRINQATARGYRAERVSAIDDIVRCLRETETRKRFSAHLSAYDLEHLRDLVGTEILRTYVCYGPRGDPASARVVLCTPGHAAVDWLAGTTADHLRTAATQLAAQAALDDVASTGATSYDFGGASIPGVAAAKAVWSGEIRPWYQVEPYGVRSLARWGLDWIRSTRDA